MKWDDGLFTMHIRELRLELLADHHLNPLLALELPENQQPFIALPAELLERARGDAELRPGGECEETSGRVALGRDLAHR